MDASPAEGCMTHQSAAHRPHPGRAGSALRLFVAAPTLLGTAVALVSCTEWNGGRAEHSTVFSRAEPFLVDSLDGSWQLVFSDDFDQTDGRLEQWWSTCHWWQVDGGCTIASNDEQQWYRPESVTVEDGTLVLEAIGEPQTTADGDTLPVRSGMVSTGPKSDGDVPGFAFTYGIAEARIRLPEAGGTWPAVWMLPVDQESRPEIDLLEWYGDRPELITSHVHADIDGEPRSQRGEVPIPDGAGQWHVVTVRWEPDVVEFFVDGVRTGIVDDPEMVPSEPMYLVLNLAMGGRSGDVDLEDLPDRFVVDDVRVWQREQP
jgi:beta-glucanase (GH16 family)